MARPTILLASRIALILVLASGLGLAVNLLSPVKIALSKDHREKKETLLPPERVVEADELAGMAEDANALVVDARSRALYETGHIPGAVSFPLKEATGELPELAPFLIERNIVTYCTGPKCKDSSDLADLFIANGLGKVKIYHRGWADWTKLGRPIETGAGLTLLEGL